MGAKNQDPGMWPSVALATRQALQVRYHYLPYLYTLLYETSQNGMGVSSVAYEFILYPSVTTKTDFIGH